MLQPEYIPAGIAIVGACIAMYTDLFKNRIIPNRLTYPLVVIGVIFYIPLGVYRHDLLIAVSGLLGAAIAFGIGYVMWLGGGWAGGDVKLFTAFGALLPMFSPPYAPAPYASGHPLFPITILFNSVIAMIPVLLVYAAICSARGRGVLYEEVKITEIKEGAIPAETIYDKGGKIGRYSGWGLSKPEWDRALTNPRMAAGLTRYQVGVLKRLVRQRKLKNHIRLKKGIPFAPALGIGLIIAVFFGDIYWFVISSLLAL